MDTLVPPHVEPASTAPLPPIVVDRSAADLTRYLCTHAAHSDVLMGHLELNRGAFKRTTPPVDVDVTRWHDHAGIAIRLDAAPFRFTHHISADEARAIARALMQAADEQDLASASGAEQ